MYTCPALGLLIETNYTTIYYGTLGIGARNIQTYCIIGGDFNVDLDTSMHSQKSINNFISNRGLARCDLTFPTATKYTYVNDALNCQSNTDYFLISDISKVCQFDISDHDSNSSDHLPLHIVCKSDIFEDTGKPIDKVVNNSEVCV